VSNQKVFWRNCSENFCLSVGAETGLATEDGQKPYTASQRKTGDNGSGGRNGHSEPVVVPLYRKAGEAARPQRRDQSCTTGPTTMAKRLSSNVLRFEPPDASSTSQQLSADSSHLLAACRDRLVHRVATGFAENMSRAVEDLLGMADRATSLDQQQAYFAAMELLERRGQELLQGFRGAYVNLFDASLAGLRRNRRNESESQYDLGELSLVDTEDFERDLAISKLSARAACNCAHQLTALDRRLAAMLRVPRVSHDENPFYPRALFNAMLQTFARMGIGQQVGLILLQEMERQTSSELPAIYGDLNRHLIDSGVLPKIPLSISRPVTRANQPAPLEDFRADTGDDDVRIALEPDAPPPLPVSPPQGQTTTQEASMSADEVFGQLLRAIQAAATGPVGPQQGMAPGPKAFNPLPTAQQQDRSGSTLDVADLVEALTSIQRGRQDARYAPVLGPNAIDPAESSALRQIRETPLANWSNPVDAFTIDIVAMLFDAIYNDPELPAALRAEIARLQIPVLKVALIDKTFFSNKRHPARRLLDAIATAAIGRNDSDEARLVSKITGIINAVVDGFETDINVFSIQVAKLEQFLNDEQSRAETKTTAVVEKLREAEREELASARANTEIASRVHRRHVPALVADFLDQHWRKVLTRAASEGPGSSAWKAALAAMDDLLWSVEPKHGSQDRDRLLTSLPDLLRRLRTGLEESGLNEAWDPFFAQLIRLHVGALHKDVPQDEYRATEEQADASLQPEPVEEDHDDRFLALDYEESAKKATEPVPPTTTPSSAPTESVAVAEHAETTASASTSEDPYLERAQSLQIGAWVEFQSFRGTRKALRLNWVSEFRGVMLFTNRQGENALTLATTSLAQHLRKRTARILSPDRLTDRAVAKLLGKGGSEACVHAD